MNKTSREFFPKRLSSDDVQFLKNPEHSPVLLSEPGDGYHHNTGNPSSFPVWLSSTSPKPAKHYSSGWQTCKYAPCTALFQKWRSWGGNDLIQPPDIGERAGQLIASVSGFFTLIQIKFLFLRTKP